MNNEQNTQAQPTEAFEIPKDLQDKVNALRALTASHNLLGEAYLPVRAHEAIKESQTFLKNLHKQMLDDCLAHPDAAKHPELASFIQAKEKAAKFAEELKQVQEEVQNGQTKEN